MAQTVGFSRALKMPHRGIFARRDAKRRARAVRIPPCNPCIVCRKNKRQRPAECCLWRRRWDSNPRGIAAKLISSQSRYDRFDTSAYLVFTAPRLEKCEISMQDNDERLGTRHPIKPAVMGFPADKVTCRMQTFESISLRPLRYVCLFGFTACYMGNMVCALLHLTHSHIAHYSIPNLSPFVNQNSRCFCVGVGSKGESSWWRRMKTWRVFSVMDRPLCLDTV